jgi:hypothetical protein
VILAFDSPGSEPAAAIYNETILSADAMVDDTVVFAGDFCCRTLNLDFSRDLNKAVGESFRARIYL